MCELIDDERQEAGQLTFERCRLNIEISPVFEVSNDEMPRHGHSVRAKPIRSTSQSAYQIFQPRPGRTDLAVTTHCINVDQLQPIRIHCKMDAEPTHSISMQQRLEDKLRANLKIEHLVSCASLGAPRS